MLLYVYMLPCHYMSRDSSSIIKFLTNKCRVIKLVGRYMYGNRKIEKTMRGNSVRIREKGDSLYTRLVWPSKTPVLTSVGIHLGILVPRITCVHQQIFAEE